MKAGENKKPSFLSEGQAKMVLGDGGRGQGRVRTLQKRTATADQLFFLRAQKIMRKCQAGRETSGEGLPCAFWKVKSLMDN